MYIMVVASLRNGFDVIIDEIENHFHKTLVENIISLYKDKSVNKNNATLIISTHYCELLDLFNRIEYASPYLPESGYIFTEGGEEDRHTVDFMKCHQYKIWLVTKTNGLALLQFTLRE